MAKTKTSTGALPQSAGFPGGKVAMSNPSFCRPIPDYMVNSRRKTPKVKRRPEINMTRGETVEWLTTGKMPESFIDRLLK